jgi:hypothetical protein
VLGVIREGLSVATSLSTTRITRVLPLALLIEESVALTDALYRIVKEEVKGNHKTRLSLVLTTVRRSVLKGQIREEGSTSLIADEAKSKETSYNRPVYILLGCDAES